MSTEEIQKFLSKNTLTKDQYLKITMKKRNAIYGVFVQAKDAGDLESKNFWRIVSVTNLKEFHKTRDINLSRIFNGTDFLKLSIE